MHNELKIIHLEGHSMLRRQKKWIAILTIIALLVTLWPATFVSTVAAADDSCSLVGIDGVKDNYWSSVPTLGESPTKGWNNAQINNLKLSNDSNYLYYWIDATAVDNWGSSGMYIDLALAVDGGNSEALTDAPWGAAGFNFSGLETAPSYHIVHRINGDNQVAGAAIYSGTDFDNPIASTWSDLNGFASAANRTAGFEGKIPLNLLEISDGSTIEAIAVLSGNDAAQHGAFDVIPEAEGNTIASTWNSSEAPNVQSTYTAPYTVVYQEQPLAICSSTPANNAKDVSVDLNEITVVFNKDVVLEDAELATISNIEAVAAAEGKTLTFSLAESLSYNTVYTVTIAAGALSGQTIDQTITFRTEHDPETLNTYNVHYFRYDEKQSLWDMWVWGVGFESVAIPFTAVDDSGFATATITTYDTELNVITRPGNWDTQEETRQLVMPAGQRTADFWFVQGSTNVYLTAEEVDVTAKVQAAFADSTTKINLLTTHEIEDNQVSEFSLYNVTDEEEVDATAKKLSATSYQLTVAADAIDVTKQYEIRHSTLSKGNVVMRTILDNQRYYYNGTDLGLTYSETESTFKVWAPTATEVALSLYEDAGEYDVTGSVVTHEGGTEIVMTPAGNGVWSTTQSGDLSGQYYMYKVSFSDGTINYVVDPYAKAVSANGGRTAVIDLKATNPSGWDTDTKPVFINPTDAVIYELHVRDFSISEDSGISEHNKGKFAAFTEEGLVDEAGNALGIDHLKELGITHLQILPSYDFKTVNELTVDDPDSTNPKFNWGYDPQNYNVPEGSYSSDPTNPTARITEFKAMVQALHENGIRVVMDVVYNHTYEIDNGPFDKIVPGYYYRTNQNGTFSNGSGVGNEIATERPMVRKFIIDSVSYWAEEYNVDGFRFDLMGIIDTATMTEITQTLHNEVDPSILLYGEPWMGGSTPLDGTDQTLKGSQKNLNFGVFNDNFRTAIKGDSDGASKGFATGDLNTIQGILNGIIGATTDFTNSPSESINYVIAHDNLNMWDKIAKTQNLYAEMNMINITNGVLAGGGSIDDAVAAATPYYDIDPSDVLANETVKRSLLANGIVLTAQGIPFLHAGDEFLRTKYGDHNSYRSPDSVNKINWTNKADFAEVNDYYKGLIALRNEHPAFRMTNKADIAKNLSVLNSSDGVVAFKLSNHANSDTWKNIIVIYNGNNHEATVSLPTALDGWNVVVDDRIAGTEVITNVSGAATLAPISMMVLYDSAEAAYTPVATSIEVTMPKKAIEPGKQVIATAKIKDQKGKVMSGETVSWSSSNENVATIAPNGRISAVAAGTAVFTATVGQITGTATIIVEQLVPTSLTISGASSVYVDYGTKLSAVVKDQYNQVMTNQAVQWTSNDALIAEVDGTGQVRGVAAGQATITATIGEISATHSIEVKNYVRRFIQFEYTRPDSTYTDWSLWVWNTGVINDQIEFTVIDGKAVAQVEVAPNVTQVGFIVKRGDWVEKDPNPDRFVNLSLDETFVKVQLTSGQVEFTQTTSVSGPMFNGNDVTFYYRNDELFRENRHNEITGVKLKIGDAQYDMTYDENNEYYQFTLEDIEEGQYEYTFLVTTASGTVEVTDPKNTVNGKSIIVYEKIEVNATASISPSTFSAGKHTILKVDTETPSTQINRVYADLTALGGGSEVAIDKELMELTLSVLDTVALGQKIIPVTIVDTNNIAHTISTTVNVTKNTSKDFDWDEASIYFMLTDRFSDGDSSNNDPNGENYDTDHMASYHGGDFQGIINKLDYLEDLGINTIWITPIVDNIDWNLGHNQPWLYQYGYHGYWAKDFTKIDEHLGDLETFKELIDKAHDRGMKIMVDVVLNHTGYGMDSNVAPADVANFPTEEERAVFDGLIRNPAGTGDILGELAGLPDLKTEDAAVRQQIIQWQVDWLTRARTDRGDTIDFFRVDTVKHVDSTTWNQFKNELTKVHDEFKLIGEVFGAYADDHRGYLGSGQMDSILDFNFKYVARDFINGNIDAVESTLQARHDKLNSAATVGQFLSSHDEDGFLVTFAGNDLGKMKVAAALQITAKGQPVIYYGEELGMSGLKEDFVTNFGDNRYDMPWDELEERSDMLTHYQKLLNARKQYSKVFSKGDRSKVAGSDADQYLVFKNSYQGSSVFVGLNTSDVEKEVTFAVNAKAGSRLQELYSGNTVTVGANSQVTVVLPARSAGGTFLLADPAKSGSGTDTDTPVQPEQPNQAIVVGESHLSNDRYVVNAPAGTAKIEIDASKLTHAVVINSGQAQFTLSKEQLDLLKATGRSVIILEVNSNISISDQLEAYSNTQAVNMQLVGSAVSIAMNEVKLEQGIELSFPALTPASELYGIYHILEDGSIQYLPTKLVDGRYKTIIHEGGSYALIHYNKTFNDVTESFWAHDLIKRAAAQQLVLGTSATSFTPQGQMTRAEFATVLVRLLDLSSESTSTFTDVADGKWYSEYVQAAYEAGLVQGRSATQFDPEGYITREEMAVLIVRTLQYMGIASTNPTVDSYTDLDQIASWARDAVNEATALGLLNGKEHNQFDPKGLLTRAEAVKVFLLMAEKR